MAGQTQSSVYQPPVGGYIPMPAIEALAWQIAARCDPERIILFGSYAYGQPQPDSDVDLMVIMDTEDTSGQEAEIRASISCDYPIDLLVRTPAYFAARLALGDFFIQQVAEQGRVLYDSGRAILAHALAHSAVSGPIYEQVGGAYLNKLTAEWVKKGERDYLTLSQLIPLDNPDFNDAISFHAQQCAEKYFKAYLQEHGVRSGKTHKLDKLLALCETVDPSFAQLRPAVAGKLKDYAVDTRYPGTDPTPAETQIAYSHMQEIRNFIRTKLGIS